MLKIQVVSTEAFAFEKIKSKFNAVGLKYRMLLQCYTFKYTRLNVTRVLKEQRKPNIPYSVRKKSNHYEVTDIYKSFYWYQTLRKRIEMDSQASMSNWKTFPTPQLIIFLRLVLRIYFCFFTFVKTYRNLFSRTTFFVGIFRMNYCFFFN